MPQHSPGSHVPPFPAPGRAAASRLVLALGIGCAGGLLLAQPATPAAGSYRQAIPGTLVTFEMVPVPAGTIMMSNAPVAVAGFHMGRTEVTWDLYDIFALGLDTKGERGAGDAIARPSEPYGAPDQGWGHAGYPAIGITRAGAEAFCRWLSGVTGEAYRLPTETEWLHAARLAIDGRKSGWQDALAWHRDNSSLRTHPSGSKAPDALGLFDLFGNAAEWVTTTDGSLAVRGGSFRDPAERLGPDASAVQDSSWNERDPQLPKSRWWLSDAPFVGFRVVMRAGG